MQICVKLSDMKANDMSMRYEPPHDEMCKMMAKLLPIIMAGLNIADGIMLTVTLDVVIDARVGMAGATNA